LTLIADSLNVGFELLLQTNATRFSGQYNALRACIQISEIRKIYLQCKIFDFVENFIENILTSRKIFAMI